ncbi:MAG: DNA mismatch repair protein MutS [Gemmatimonadota bacterium]
MSRDTTPLMQQYRDIKVRHQDAILLFRMGDFYEMFYEDAEVASRVLGLTLTSRNNGGAAEVPLAGVPVKAMADYLRRLIQEGFRVAICEQVEDPREAKGIVRREVVETITPGAAYADDLLDQGRNNYLCALHRDRDRFGVAAADLSTGTFRVVLTGSRDVAAAISRFAPRELVIARSAQGDSAAAGLSHDGTLITEREPREFDADLAVEELARHYRVHPSDGTGLGEDPLALTVAGALLRYLRELQPAGIPQLAKPVLERTDTVMSLDEMTRRNLELVETLMNPGAARSGENSGTLLGVLDRTRTPMGARLLRHWLLAPLVLKAAIEARLDAVEALVTAPVVRARLRELLSSVRDIERLAGKVAAARANPREMVALGTSIARLPQVRELMGELEPGGLLRDLMADEDDGVDIAGTILDRLEERPPTAMGEGDVIRAGFDRELDELRLLRDGGREAIARIQAHERERTGIQSLKVGYNRVFGYFLEVSNSNRHLVPGDYQRRQTLTGGERYVTPALKEHEERVLSASEGIEARESTLFDALRKEVGAAIARLQAMAARVASLDVLSTFAEVAHKEKYTRPLVDEGFDLEIVAGRHPVVERMMARDAFIPNDVQLRSDARLIILTGPNMAGKSTILRQTGLIQLMGQCGCFVPAARAVLGIVDRLFTRVGASDNLVRGQSTFMVEMAETAAIVSDATARSLVLLDEIGRGTSTFDGVSIAWAVSEYLHDVAGCKTIFATHYHELTQLAGELPALRNMNVAVREVGDQIVFLHRLQPGGADRSYGIEVGRLAGLPPQVIARAREVLHSLEGEQLAAALEARSSRREIAGQRQLSLFASELHPVVDQLQKLDVNALTPLDAIRMLDDLSRRSRDG